MKKICSRCKAEKDACEFGRDKNHKSGLRSACRECFNKNRRKIKPVLLNPNFKICGKCKLEKDKKEFSKNKTKKDGLHNRCKDCDREYRSIPENKEHRKEYDREYNSIPGIKQHKKEYNKQYRSMPENKKHEKEYKKEYCLIPKNKEHIREHNKQYRKNNPNKILTYHAQRRSLKARASTISFTKEEYFDRMSVFNFSCAYCGGPWEHDDHVIPLSKGGLNVLANLRPACAHCNLSKGSKLLKEWLTYV